MSLQRNDSLFFAAPKAGDSRYDNDGQGYADVAAANAAILQSFRHVGLTVNIQGVEYWYDGGVLDGNLVLKSGNNLTNISDSSGNALTIGNSSESGSIVLTAESSDLNANILLTPKGTGKLQAGGNHTANISENSDLITKEYADNNYGADVSGLAVLADDENVTGNWTFANDLTISGNLTVTGSTVQVDSQIVTATTVLDMNTGEVGSGVTLGYSGIKVDRGSASEDFWFGYDEVRDEFTVGLVNPTLSTGEIASTKVLAAREDNPLSGGVATWNNSNQQLEFISISSLVGINYGSNSQVPYSDGSQFLYSSNMQFDGSKLLLSALDVDNVSIDANTINTISGDLTLDSQGTIILGKTASIGTNSIVNSGNSIIINGSTGSITSSSSVIGNISILGNTINTSSGDLIISSFTGIVQLPGINISGGAIIPTGNLSINNAYTIPTAAGTEFQVMTVNADGNVVFADPAEAPPSGINQVLFIGEVLTADRTIDTDSFTLFIDGQPLRYSGDFASAMTDDNHLISKGFADANYGGGTLSNISDDSGNSLLLGNSSTSGDVTLTAQGSDSNVNLILVSQGNGDISLTPSGSGNINTRGDLLPTVSGSDNLGSPTNQYNRLYISGFIQNLAGNVQIQDNLVPTVSSSFSLGNISLAWGSLYVDNLLLDGNTLSSLDSNGPIIFSPNGTGTIQASTAHTTNISGNDDIITKGYADANYVATSKSHIWAEENGAFDSSANSGFQFSFGNGATSTEGMTIGYNCTATTLTISSETSATGSVELYKNSVATGHIISLTAQESNTIDITESISKGDRISFRTISGSDGDQIVVGLVIEST